MDQILIDLVNKLTKSQYNTLSTLVGSGDALNKNKERQHANEKIFLKNLKRTITGKNILEFVTSEDHKEIELPKHNWDMCNKILQEKTKEQKKHEAIRSEAESLPVLRRIRTETHKQMMAPERQLASERKKGQVPLVVTSLTDFLIMLLGSSSNLRLTGLRQWKLLIC